jgi:hypothetical protein
MPVAYFTTRGAAMPAPELGPSAEEPAQPASEQAPSVPGGRLLRP